MKNSTASQIAQAIQLLKLDGIDYSYSQLARASGVSSKTLTRNKELVTMIDFALHKGGYYTCTHEVGTYSNKYIIYTKDYYQFIKDRPFNYRFKDKVFTLKDGIFKHDKLSFKLPTCKSISPIERVILNLGFPLNSIDGNSNIDIQETSFKSILNTLTALSLKNLGLVPKNMNLNKRLTLILFCCMNIYKMHNNIVAKGREYGVLKLLHTIWDKVCPLYFLSEYIIYKYV